MLLACDGAFISLAAILFLLLSWLLIANFSVRFLGSLVVKVLVVGYFKKFCCRKDGGFRIGRRRVSASRFFCGAATAPSEMG